MSQRGLEPDGEGSRGLRGPDSVVALGHSEPLNLAGPAQLDHLVLVLHRFTMVKDEQYDSDASLYEDDGSPGPAKRPRHRKNPSELEISTTGSPEAWQPLAGATLDASVDGFWRHHINIAETRDDSDLKRLPLPLSRIKKVMRADPDVKVTCNSLPPAFQPYPRPPRRLLDLTTD